MAFDAQVAVFIVPVWDGSPVSVPPELNPSGYDVVALQIDFNEPAAADSYSSWFTQRTTYATTIGGGTATINTGTDECGSPLPIGNAGLISTGGAWAALVAGAPANARFVATLQKGMGGRDGFGGQVQGSR